MDLVALRQRLRQADIVIPNLPAWKQTRPNFWSSRSASGHYTIVKTAQGFGADFYDRTGHTADVGLFSSLLEAKAACQKHAGGEVTPEA